MAHAETEEEVLQLAAEHAGPAHGLTAVRPTA